MTLLVESKILGPVYTRVQVQGMKPWSGVNESELSTVSTQGKLVWPILKAGFNPESKSKVH